MFANSRTYGEMKLDNLQHTIVNRLAAVISALVVGLIVMIVASIAIIFLSIVLLLALRPYVGGTVPASLILCAVYSIIGIYVYLRRKVLIAIPVKRMINEVFFDDAEGKTAHSEREMENVKNEIVEDYHTLVAPPPPAYTRFGKILSATTQAWNVIDGAILGYKLYKKAKRFF